MFIILDPTLLKIVQGNFYLLIKDLRDIELSSFIDIQIKFFKIRFNVTTTEVLSIF